MNNEEFREYIRGQVRSAYNQGPIAVIDEAIYEYEIERHMLRFCNAVVEQLLVEVARIKQ